MVRSDILAPEVDPRLEGGHSIDSSSRESTFDEADLLAEARAETGLQRVHIDSSQAAYRGDGSFELAVAHRDPGHPNWITTAGHEHGTMGLRWVLAESTPRRARAW